MAKFNFKAIGTSWQIDIYQDVDEKREAKILFDVKNRIEIFESNYSRFRDNSIVTQISGNYNNFEDNTEESTEKNNGNIAEPKVFTLPDDAEKMLSLYHELYTLTDGYFTPFIGNLLSDAGYDAKYSLETKEELSIPPKWDDVIEYHHPKLLVKKPVLLDFGAAGKGYIIDLVGELLGENNIHDYCIDAGGDILHKNKTPIRIGLENPENTGQVIGVYTLENGSLCGSAGNRRAWGNFNHIMNPKTLNSKTEIIAVWVKAESAMLADALTTCLFFVPSKILLEKYKFEYCIMRKDFSIEKSSDFYAEFFS